MPNLYLDKVCLVNFQLNASLCDPKNNNETSLMLQDNETVTPFTSSVADQVQSYVSTLKIYESLISTIPAIIFALVLGPWSEKNGRKPLMIVPTVGFLLSSFFYMFVDSFTLGWSVLQLFLNF